jgi:hypothetical protein
MRISTAAYEDDDMANAGTGLLESTAPPLRISYAIEEVPGVRGIPRTKIYEAVRDGRLTRHG